MPRQYTSPSVDSSGVGARLPDVAPLFRRRSSSTSFTPVLSVMYACTPSRCGSGGPSWLGSPTGTIVA
jgi:hypothetical protein